MAEQFSPTRKLIVLHTPKCGGTSLYASLRAIYGAKSIYRHYGHSTAAVNNRGNPQDAPVIFGHFRANIYGGIDNAVRVTLMREPLDRLLSLYFNWRFSPLRTLKSKPTPLRRLVRQGRLSLVDFAKRKRISNSLSAVYFKNFDMSRFDLIIWHDDYSNGLKQFSDLIGHDIAEERANVSSSRSKAYDNARKRTLADDGTIAALRDILGPDIDFYQRTRAMWAERNRGGFEDNVLSTHR